MRPAQLSAVLAKTIAARLPVLIKGAPGIGKTDVVVQAAKAAKADLVVMHPVVSDPTDFKGLPAVVGDEAEFLPFGELSDLIDASKLTVCFFDDLGQAPAAVQAAAMQLILARRINSHVISDKVVFVAATNRREDRAGVTGILEPVKSRFATIIELNPNVDDWCGWALENGVPPELVAFVRFRPELLMSATAPTADIVNRPSPRTVTNLGKLIGIGIDDLETLAGAVGEGFAAEFIGFLRVWASLPSIDGILLNPEKADIPSEQSALYAVTVALASRTTADNAGRIVRYMNRLPDEFSVLGIRDAKRVCPTLERTREFVKWAVDHQDVLL